MVFHMTEPERHHQFPCSTGNLYLQIDEIWQLIKHIYINSLVHQSWHYIWLYEVHIFFFFNMLKQKCSYSLLNTVVKTKKQKKPNQTKTPSKTQKAWIGTSTTLMLIWFLQERSLDHYVTIWRAEDLFLLQHIIMNRLGLSANSVFCCKCC